MWLFLPVNFFSRNIFKKKLSSKLFLINSQIFSHLSICFCRVLLDNCCQKILALQTLAHRFIRRQHTRSNNGPIRVFRAQIEQFVQVHSLLTEMVTNWMEVLDKFNLFFVKYWLTDLVRAMKVANAKVYDSSRKWFAAVFWHIHFGIRRWWNVIQCLGG